MLSISARGLLKREELFLSLVAPEILVSRIRFDSPVPSTSFQFHVVLNGLLNRFRSELNIAPQHSSAYEPSP